MIKLLMLFSIVGCLVSCKVQDDLRGTFSNDNGQEITIDCNYLIHSKHLSGRDFMPKNGDKIELSRTSIENQEITLSFLWEDIQSAFAKWDPYKDELTIGNDIYSRKSFIECKEK